LAGHFLSEMAWRNQTKSSAQSPFWSVRPIGTLPILLRSLSGKMAIGRGAMEFQRTAIQRQEQAVREKLVGYVFLASLAAVIAFILCNHIVMF
jgi:hypothetical protein